MEEVKSSGNAYLASRNYGGNQHNGDSHQQNLFVDGNHFHGGAERKRSKRLRRNKIWTIIALVVVLGAVIGLGVGLTSKIARSKKGLVTSYKSIKIIEVI